MWTRDDLRSKLLKIADVKYDKVLKADVPHDCVWVAGKLKADGGECESFCVGRDPVHPQKELDLAHRSGGTAIEVWGREQNPPICWGRFRNRGQEAALGLPQDMAAVLGVGNCRRRSSAQGYPAYGHASSNMCIVRNPYDRAASQVTCCCATRRWRT